jgi:superfamily I DNA/RNA helicase
MGGWNTVAKPEERGAYINAATAKVASENLAHPLFERSAEFIADEIRWISQLGIQTFEEYMATQAGLPVDLPAATTLPLLWQIWEEYRSNRQSAGKLYDWDDIAISVRDEFAADGRERYYQHVIIDEGQDFSPVMIQSLVRAVPAEGSVTFFGDIAQQIYGSRVSWRSRD